MRCKWQKLIIEKNGSVKTSTKVEKIIIENNCATGVKLSDGSVDSADIVIASGSIPDIFDDVIGRENLPKDLIDKIDNLRYMESCFFVHLGVNFNPLRSQKKQLCYYYGTYDIEGAIEESRKGIYHEGKEGFLIYVPSIHSPEMAPEGKYAVTIYTICPDRLADGTWEEKKEEYADLLIQEAEKKIPGLYEGIETKMIMTPADFRKQINDFPLIVGAGLNYHNVFQQLKIADAGIVGSELKEHGSTREMLDHSRIKRFMDSVKELRENI